jgi:hypothetical protein
MMMRHIVLWLLAVVLVAHAQDEAYPPGTFQLTAEIDLHLQPSRLIVPYQYTTNTRPEDHNITLNLTRFPGQVVRHQSPPAKEPLHGLQP